MQNIGSLHFKVKVLGEHTVTHNVTEVKRFSRMFLKLLSRWGFMQKWNGAQTSAWKLPAKDGK